MFNTTINDNSKNTGFFNNNLKNEVNITTKKGLFKTKVTVSSSKRNKKKGCDFMFNVTINSVNSKGLVSVISDDKITRKKRFLDRNKSIATKSSISSGKKKPSLFNKKKEGISMNKNLVKVLVAGVAVGVAVAGAVVITKKVKARKARKAENVKDENINEVVEEEVEETEEAEEETVEEVNETTEETEEVAEDDTKEDVSENDEESEMEDSATEEAETENDDNDDVPVLVEIILIRVGKFVGICIGLLLGNLILRDSARLAEATKCL